MARKAGRPTRFWHGGTPGLRPGQRILPASKVERLPLSAITLVDGDQHYANVTTDRALARGFAAFTIAADGTLGGSLYNVRPVGDLVADPDYPVGVAYKCTAAVIVSVAELRPAITDPVKIALNRYNLWEDGELVYDPSGAMMPSPVMASFGVTAADLAPLGVCPPVDSAISHVCRKFEIDPDEFM